ncbi:MAG: helix-turn-helix transcriptional regulator [Bacilli bacterium]
MNIGQNILNLRKGANLSQEQLAEIIGVTRQTISNWELEESSPDLKQAKELSRFFNVSLDDLTGDSTFEYLGGNNRENEITIISSVENVIVTCNKIQASQEYKGGKNSPKFALFGYENGNNSIFGGNNTFLGWYENGEELKKEIDLKEALANDSTIMEEIINKLTIVGVAMDGGTTVYRDFGYSQVAYSELGNTGFTIIRCNRIQDYDERLQIYPYNKDYYFGDSTLEFEEGYCE